MDPYAASGVSLDANERAVALIKGLAGRATRPEVRGDIGGFAGLFEIAPGRYLVAGTDGVGTKAEIARQAWKLDTVGIDLVGMCANDVVCTGAEPLFFLDYIAVGQLVPEEVAALVEGVAKGCKLARCALLGGETAEHPGVMEVGQFDLAGFCVGVVTDDELLGPQKVEEGDLLVGLESSGLHSNGFSLIRRVLLEDGPLSLDQVPFGLWRPLGNELLEPTRIYVPLMLELNRRGLLHAAAHITGGGLYENLPRALPGGLGAVVDTSTWEVPPIFQLVQQAAGATTDEMFHILNMGIGMVLVVPEGREEEVLTAAQSMEVRGHVMGRVVAGSGLSLEP
jgi:phosphoribosylformylglycinamidine cyclo-ligase